MKKKYIKPLARKIALSPAALLANSDWWTKNKRTNVTNSTFNGSTSTSSIVPDISDGGGYSGGDEGSSYWGYWGD